MKKALSLVCFFVLMISTIATQEVTTQPLFLGIEWGTSQNAIHEFMLNRNFVELPEENRTLIIDKGFIVLKSKDPKSLYMGKFAGRDAIVALFFYHDMFYESYVILTPQESIESDYSELFAVLKEKYGNPTPPSFDDMAYWLFNPGEIDFITISESKNILISYIDGIISKQWDKEKANMEAVKKAKELSDL